MKIITYISLITVCMLCFWGFQKKEPKTQQDLMQEYIEGQLEEVRQNEWKKCTESIILSAEQFVDSIIYQRVEFNIGDSLKAPGKPIKPQKPFDTLILDTTPVKPIFNKGENEI